MDKNFYQKIMQDNQNLSLREVVLLVLRKAILTGQLEPGERLMELHISQEMGVSRTPVREAIKELESEGLVEMSPHRGAHVASITEKQMKDVLEVRRILEGLSVATASRRISEPKLAELEAAMKNCEAAMETDDCIAVAEADIKFHDIILEASDNDKLRDIMNNISDQIYRYRYEFIREKKHYETMKSEHMAIFRALKRGDEDGAITALQYHIDNQAEVILQRIRDSKTK